MEYVDKGRSLDLADKRIRLGLQYPDSLDWRNWVPGREYHKVLFVRNNINNTQVLKWSPPPSSHFWTIYHEPVRLNGMVTAAIGVVFRPLKFQSYESGLDFSTAKGSFTVVLRGIPPRVQISFQKHLWLGFCPVNDFVEKRFVMKNVGDTVLTPAWDVQLPFSLSPEKCTMKAGDNVTVTARFSPRRAGPYEAVALCWIGKYSAKLKLHGVGKHSFLILSQPVLNFGSLFLGTSRVIYLRVANNSTVPSFYRLKRPDTSLDESLSDFTIEPQEGTISQGSTLYLKITYTPTVAGSCPLEHLDLVVPQTSPVTFTCVGGVIRPSLRINSFAISFGSVESGIHSSRSVTLKNRTDMPVVYQFMPADMNVFQFEESRGCISPRSTVILTVKFKPIEPANYYVRVICIIQDQYPLYCDLVGTCYREMVKAPTLMTYHVDRQRQLLLERKTGPAAPNYWNFHKTHQETETVEEDQLTTASETGTGVPEMLKGLLVASDNRQSTFGDFYAPNYLASKKALKTDEVWHEYFLGRIEGWDPVTLDIKHLDFGKCSCSEPAPLVKHVTLRNNCRDGHVNVLWLVREPQLEVIKPTGAFVDSDFSEVTYSKNFDPVFQVWPPLAQITAGEEFTFKVTYKPKKDNLYYFKHLSCFVYEVRISEDESYVAPPWSTFATAFGHSFPSNSWEVRPEASFVPHRVVFPPALKGSSVYQTATLRNHRHTSLRFVFQQDALLPNFTVIPTEGVIPGNDFQLVSFRFTAGEPGMYTDRLCCKLNHSLVDELWISMFASSHYPEIKFSNDGFLCFKPTNIGTQENLPMIITNRSGVGLQYDFHIPMEYGDVLSISPISGVLRGKEKQEVICTFSPTEQKYYSFQVSCSFSALTETGYYQEHKILIRNSPSSRTDYATLDVDGEGLIGVITMEPPRADFGMLVVGDEYEHRLTLFNSTKGLLDYVLVCNSLTVPREKYWMEFDSPSGTLQPRSYMDVNLLFKLKHNMNYKIDIICKTLAPTTDECLAKSKPDGFHTTCAFSATAAYPSVVITGVRSERLSAAQLWNRMRIDELNVILGEPPKASATQSAYKYLFGLGKPLDEFEPFVLRFMTQNVARKASVVHLVFQCRVPLTVRWRLRMWNDSEVDMESWVEDGDPSEEEKRLMNVWSMQLFEIEPRRGVLRPGEEAHIRFTYNHKIEGFHNFPAILEIEKGYVLQLMLSGKTLPFSAKILGLPTHAYTLSPVVVGELNPPVQTFEVRNDGYIQLTYHLDTSPLLEIQEQNHGFPVLQCLNPKGWIAASESILLTWLFQPLEPKLYCANLKIYVEGGKMSEFTVQGMGFSSTDRASLRLPHMKSPFGKAYLWPGVPAKLSTEFLDFGHVKDLALTQKLISIHNVSDEFDVAFTWRKSMAAEFNVYGEFDVFPPSGVIEPCREVLCKVRFRAGIQPQSLKTTLYCDVAIANLEPPPRPKLVQPSTPDEVIDKDGVRLGTGVYNKNFKHVPVVNQCPSGMKGKLPHFSAKPLSPLPTPPKEIIPTEQVLFLTVNAEIHTAEKFHSTSERIMPRFISYKDNRNEEEKIPDATSKSTQLELSSTVLTEMLQECLVEESRDKETDSFKLFDDKRVAFFEEFQSSRAEPSEPRIPKPGSPPEQEEEDNLEPAFALREKESIELILDSLLFGIVKEICEEDSLPSSMSCRRSSSGECL